MCVRCMYFLKLGCKWLWILHVSVTFPCLVVIYVIQCLSDFTWCYQICRYFSLSMELHVHYVPFLCFWDFVLFLSAVEWDINVHCLSVPVSSLILRWAALKRFTRSSVNTHHSDECLSQDAVEWMYDEDRAVLVNVFIAACFILCIHVLCL